MLNVVGTLWLILGESNTLKEYPVLSILTLAVPWLYAVMRLIVSEITNQEIGIKLLQQTLLNRFLDRARYQRNGSQSNSLVVAHPRQVDPSLLVPWDSSYVFEHRLLHSSVCLDHLPCSWRYLHSPWYGSLLDYSSYEREGRKERQKRNERSGQQRRLQAYSANKFRQEQQVKSLLLKFCTYNVFCVNSVVVHLWRGLPCY